MGNKLSQAMKSARNARIAKAAAAAQAALGTTVKPKSAAGNLAALFTATVGSKSATRNYANYSIPDAANALRPNCKRGQFLTLLLTTGITVEDTMVRFGWAENDVKDAINLLANKNGTTLHAIGDVMFVQGYGTAKAPRKAKVKATTPDTSTVDDSNMSEGSGLDTPLLPDVPR